MPRTLTTLQGILQSDQRRILLVLHSLSSFALQHLLVVTKQHIYGFRGVFFLLQRKLEWTLNVSSLPNESISAKFKRFGWRSQNEIQEVEKVNFVRFSFGSLFGFEFGQCRCKYFIDCLNNSVNKQLCTCMQTAFQTLCCYVIVICCLLQNSCNV